MIANLQLARRGLGSPLPCNVLLPANYSGHPMRLSETVHGCRWIVQHDRGETESWICGAPCEPGHSFCRAHHSRVFVKKEPEA